MKCLVIGFGSIGSRHARILTELGLDVAVLSHHSRDYPLVYRDLEKAVKEEDPEYIVISNNTNEHFATLEQLISLGFNKKVLVEKPLYEKYSKLELPGFIQVFIGYNLRFHPIIIRLRELVQQDTILSAQAYVGQYLPEWRPGRDYCQCYSSHKSEGGGVIRDLSHELDYITWLFEGWNRLTAVGGKFSSLKVTSDDFFSLMLEMKKCPLVNVQLNYMDRITQRQIIIVGEQHSYRADLIQGTIIMDGNIEEYKVDRDYTYREMHLALLHQDYENLCTYRQGLEILKLIDAAEKASADERWIYNE